MASESKKRVLIPIGNGSCLMHTACLSSTLRKFGAEVVIASVNETLCDMREGERVSFYEVLIAQYDAAQSALSNFLNSSWHI